MGLGILKALRKKNRRLFLVLFLRFLINFASNLWGIFQTPYKTTKRIVAEKRFIQAGVILLVIPLYTLLSTPVKYGLSAGWLFLLWAFIKSTLWTYTTYFLACFLIYFVGKKFGGSEDFLGVFSLWAFSLIPTYLWFFTTVILYLILPPPRTTSIYGYSLSILFIAYSISLLWWKIILYYLTLRHACKLSLQKIAKASFILWPAGVIYSFLTYKLGVFKIPFI